MLTQKDKEALNALGINADKLVEATIAEKEIALGIPAGQVFTDEQLTKRDENVKKEALLDGEKQGELKARKLLAKEVKAKTGVEVKEDDRIGDILEQVSLKANSSVDEKVKLKEEQLNNVKNDLLAATEKNKQFESQIKEAHLDRKILGSFPKDRSSTLSDTEYLTLIKTGMSFEEVDGKVIVKKDGQALRDSKNHDTLTVDAALKLQFSERGWISDNPPPPAGGRGGGDSQSGSGSGAKTFTQAQKEWLEKNPKGNVISPECSDYVGEVAAADPQFDWNS